MSTEKKKICVFLFDGFSDWEISYLTPELQKSDEFELNYVSVDGYDVKSMGGLTIKTDYSVDQLDPSQISLLVLPGGSAWEKNLLEGIDELIETSIKKGATIGAICGATTHLARNGYLDNIAHTSNALFYLKSFADNYKGEEYYKDELSVIDKNIITANGIAPIEFARDIFKKIELHTEKDIEQWYQLFKNGIWSE